jgi:hypothetical protein
MNHLKIIGLAVVAVAAFMAFVGAGSASAGALCTVNTDPCPTGKTVTTLDASLVGSASLKETTGSEFTTCTTGTFHGTVEKQGEGINPQGPITSLTWGASGAGCNTTVDTVKPGRFEERTEEGAQEVWISGLEFTVVAFGVSCTYGFGSGLTFGPFDAGHDPKVTANAVPQKTAGSFLCPSTSRWTGTYTITNHTEIYTVSKGLD